MNIRPAIKTYALNVREDLVNKKNCLREAERILAEKHIEHMSREQLAQEIFFHALVYDFCRKHEHLHIGLLSRLKRHADPIDLSDYGDSPFRKFCFRLFWFLPGAKQKMDQPK